MSRWFFSGEEGLQPSGARDEARPGHDDGGLELPELGDGSEDGNGLAEESAHDIELSLADDGGDPFDDEEASDVPLDIVLSTGDVQPTAIGDDALGVEGTDEAHGVDLQDDDASFLGDDAEGLDPDDPRFGGDVSLGLDPIPRELDDGGAEGLDDAGDEQVDAEAFPPLDGQEDDDDAPELDLGLDLDGLSAHLGRG